MGKMSVLKLKGKTYNDDAGAMPPLFSNDVSIDPIYDGVVMLGHDLHLFGDAEVRPDGRKVFHIFERAPEDEQVYDNSRLKIYKKDKKALWLKTCESTFKNIEGIMEKNGVLLDEWCPPLSESGQNSRGNTVNTIRRQRVTFKKQTGKRNVKKKNNYQEPAKKIGLPSLSKNKKGKENGNSIAKMGEASKVVSLSNDSKKGRNVFELDEENKFKCPNCFYTSMHKSNVNAHFLRYCPNKDKAVSSNSNSLKRGKLMSDRRNSPRDKFVSDHKNFKNKKILPAKDRYYLCDMCNFSTHYKGSIDYHKLTHLKDKKFTCPFCGFGSNVLNRIYNHISKKHKDIDEKRIQAEKLNCCSKGKRKNSNDSGNNISNFNSLKSLRSRRNEPTKKGCLVNKSPTSDNDSANISLNMNCSVVLNKFDDMQVADSKPYVNSDENIASKVDYNITIKGKCQMEPEYGDSPNTENRSQVLKSEFLDDKEEIQSSLDLVKIEDKELLSQDVKSPNIFGSSIPLINNYKNFEIRSENLSKNEDEKIKVTYQKAEKGISEKEYEVIQRKVGETETILFKSLDCSYSTIFKYKIIQHCITHKKNKIYKCLDCNFTAKCLFLLKLHKKTHIENHFECPLCPFSTTSGPTMKSHKFWSHKFKKSVHSKSIYNCNSDVDKHQQDTKISLRSMTKCVERRSSRTSSTVSDSRISKDHIVSKSTLNCKSDADKNRGDIKRSFRSRRKCVKRKSSHTSITESASRISKDQIVSKSTLNCKSDADKNRGDIKRSFRSRRKCVKRKSSHTSITESASRISKDQKRTKRQQAKQGCETKTFKRRNMKIVNENLKSDKCSFFTDNEENLSRHKESHTETSGNIKTSAKDSLSFLDDKDPLSLYDKDPLSLYDNKGFVEDPLSLSDDKDPLSFSDGKVSVKDPSDGEVKEHKNRLSGFSLSCESCSFTTSLRIDLLKHKQSHLSSPAGVFKCTECSFSCTKNKVLISHLMNHAYEYVYRCIHCNFSANNKGTLKLHKNSHRTFREKTNIRSFRNNKMTVSLQPKNIHKFKCFRCDYSCSSEHLLNQHTLTHLENKLLKCAHCDYETNFKGNLLRHVLIHVDEYIE